MSLTQSCFSVRFAATGLRSSFNEEAIGQLTGSADRVLLIGGLRPRRQRTGHGARHTAGWVRRVEDDGPARDRRAHVA